MKIRIVDIAKQAGVSVGTVDRFMHKRGKVSEKARLKVEKAIKELGYEPDLMARNLALKKELNIVCLLPDPQSTRYWQRPLQGVEKAVAELVSFKVKVETVMFAPREDDFKKACNKVLAMQPDGVVYVPMFFKTSVFFAEKLHETNTPFIHINIHHAGVEPMSFIGQNPIAAGKVAASLCNMALKEKESILVTYISKEAQEYSHHQDRIDGFLEYFNKTEGAAPAIRHLHIKTSDSEVNYEKELLHFLDVHSDVKIIYVPNSRAYQVAGILKKNNVQKKMIIGFDTLRENVRLLKEGYIEILIGQQSKAQGYHAVISMFNALFRKEEVKNVYCLPIDVLNCQNIDFYRGGVG